MKSSISRRNLIKILAAGGASLLLPGPWLARALAQPAALQVRRLNERVLVISGAGCNVLVRQDDEGLLVVDGGLEAHTASLLQSLRAETGTDRIATLVNTHWHREQTGLNAAAGAQGARILAHENTRDWLGARIQRLGEETVYEPLPEAARPTETFFHFGEFTHGGAPVRYGYLRQAHTDGDMYIHLPDDKVLHAGGVISSDGWPLLDWWTGGSISGLAEAYDSLVAVADDDTVIVPANGPLMNKAQLLEMRAMYATIDERIRGMYMKANSAEDTVLAKPAGEFEARMGDSDRFVRQAHESLIAHITPDA